jgi:multiple sugar transport system permease protein
LPKDLENAAKIDGCGFLSAYVRIVFPVSRSASLLVFVLSVVWHWNDYYEPVIYIGRQKSWPLPSMLPSIYDKFYQAAVDLSQSADTVITEGVVMAATFLVILPILVVYSFLQKQFIEGAERSGLVE